MSYTYDNSHSSPNFTRGRPMPPQEITIHHWGKEGQRRESVINWLCRPNGTSSATYVAEDSYVACLVDPDDTAWANGNFASNQQAISIECRPEMTPGDFETVAELIADIRKAYPSITRIRGHKDHKATACPGKWYPRLQELWDRATAIIQGSRSTPAPTPAPAPAPAPAAKTFSQMADEIIRGLHGNGHANRQRSLGVDSATYQAVRAEVNRRLLG